jgi:hypothetical protein
MRIVGGHDYYDRVLRFGHDAHTTYVRGRTELPAAEARAMGIHPSRLLGSLVRKDGVAGRRARSRVGRAIEFNLAFPTVLACGKRYQGVHVVMRTVDGHCTEMEVHLWTAEAFRSWLAEHGLSWEPAEAKPWAASEAIGTHGPRDVDAYFSPQPLAPDVLRHLVERRWTILSHARERFRFDAGETPWKVDQPSLGQTEFFRAVPHDTMYQEIEMWIGGTLPGAAAPMAEVPDHIRLAKHGMDATSFRRGKGEKKPRKHR